MSNEHVPTTLYERLPNGKYKPVSEYLDHNHWREGSYIVDVLPGCTSITKQVDVTRAIQDVQIILHRLCDRICRNIMRGWNEPQKPRELTKAQKEAYYAWCKAFNTDKIMLSSIHEAVEKALEEVVDEAMITRKQEYR